MFVFEVAVVEEVGVICDRYAYIPISFGLTWVVGVGMRGVGSEREVNISLPFTHSNIITGIL